MFEFLKSTKFHMIFSFIVGLFIVLVLRPICKGESCNEHKNPDTKEMISSVYQLGSHCYQFQTTTVDCIKK